MARKHNKHRGIEAVRLANGKEGWRVRLYHHGRQWRSRVVLSKTLALRVYQQKKIELHEHDHFPRLAQLKHAQRLTIDDLISLVLADYRRNRRKTLKEAERMAAFWRREAGAKRADEVTGAWLMKLADAWLKAGLATATVNRRMDKLRKGFRLACTADPPLLFRIPRWERLKESPPRSGYMEFPVFVQVRARLRMHHRVPVTIAFWTGMRWGEITGIRRAQQRFNHQQRSVHLDLSGHQTKTGQPRRAVLYGDLYETLWAWEQETSRHYPTCPWVCHRQGRRIGTIDTAWKTACVELGLGTGELIKSGHSGRTYYWRKYKGPLLHDFRRVGVRNLESAGVSRQVGKAISGHKTDSVYNRYNIVSEEDLADAGAKVVEYVMRKAKQEAPNRQETVIDHP